MKRKECDEPSLGDGTLGLKFVFFYGGFDSEVSIGDGDLGTAVGEFCSNMFVGVKRVLRLYSDRMRTADGGRVDWEYRFRFRVRGVIP